MQYIKLLLLQFTISLITDSPISHQQPAMNNLFNKVINNQQFNFQPLEFGNKTGYHVDVKDDEGTRWEFSNVSYN
jgi:hypothetical protein